MILAEGLSKRFEDFWAVRDISLNVPAGEVLALLGPNGAGKTTTVRMLSSVLIPTQGRAQVAGFDIQRQAAEVRRSVGVLTEQHGLYTRMPADEYLNFFGEIYGVSAAVRQERIRRLLDEFGLLSVRHKRLGEFSKGMRQKLALARALLHDPPVLLLDEPTSAMDPESARLVRDEIQALRSAHRTIILCTHNLAEAEQIADQIAIIRQGRIIARGTPQTLKMRLLGPAEYEIRLARPLNGQQFELPVTAQLTARGKDWFRLAVADPATSNPEILQACLNQGLAVVSMQEVPRSLEQVYLQAVSAAQQEESSYA